MKEKKKNKTVKTPDTPKKHGHIAKMTGHVM